MALDRLTKIDGGGISTTSDYRVGVITATKFVGPIDGVVTGSLTGTATTAVNAQGLIGNPNITVGILTASSANFSGNVTIGGTLTYEDVTNIDSVGIITARDGIKVSTGTATTALVVEGDGRITGILTVGTSSLKLDGPNNVVNVGTALTLGHSQGVQFHTQNLHSEGFEVNNINASGIGTFGDIHVKSNPSDTRITSIAPGALILSRNAPVIYLKDNLSDNFDASIELQSNELRFRGGGNNATGIRMETTSSGVSFPQDIDVDGHTNLDNVSIAGIITAQSGIHIDDSITHTGDTNTKIRFPANDTFTVETAGSERFRIDPNGHITVGVAASALYNTYLTIPRYAVDGDAAKFISLRNDVAPADVSFVKSRSTTYGSYAATQDDDPIMSINSHIDTGAALAFRGTYRSIFDTATGGVHFMWGSGTSPSTTGEKMRLTATGNLGIGTVSPSAILHLHKASGDALQKIESSNGAAVLDLRHTNGYGYINYRQDGAETFRVGQIAQFTSYSVYNPNSSLPYQLCVEGNGEVGINTNNPTNTLHLLRNSTNHGITLQRGGTNAGSASINVTSFGALDLTASNNFNITSGGSQQIIFNRGGTEVARFNTAGSLGIGTNAPASNMNLHVLDQTDRCYVTFESGGNESCQLWLKNPARTWKISNYYDQNALTFTDDSDERLRIDSSGHLHTGYSSNFGNDHLNILASDGGGVSIASNNAGNATTGDILGSLSFQGYLNTQTYSNAEARISAVVASNHTGSSAATDMVFYTKPSTTGPGSAPTEGLRIKDNGYIGVNESSPQRYFQVTGNASYGAAHFGVFGTNAGNAYIGNTPVVTISTDGNGNAGTNDEKAIFQVGRGGGGAGAAAVTTDLFRVNLGGSVQIGGAVSNNSDIDVHNTKLTIKQTANNKEDGIYLERSGERRGWYMFVGSNGGYNDAFSITTNQMGTDTDVLAIDRGNRLAKLGGDVIIDSTNNGYGGLRIYDDSSGGYNVNYVGGRSDGNMSHVFKSGGRSQNQTPWVDSSGSEIMRVSLSNGLQLQGDTDSALQYHTGDHYKVKTGGKEAIHIDNRRVVTVAKLNTKAHVFSTCNNRWASQRSVLRFYMDFYTGASSATYHFMRMISQPDWSFDDVTIKQTRFQYSPDGGDHATRRYYSYYGNHDEQIINYNQQGGGSGTNASNWISKRTDFGPGGSFKIHEAANGGYYRDLWGSDYSISLGNYIGVRLEITVYNTVGVYDTGTYATAFDFYPAAFGGQATQSAADNHGGPRGVWFNTVANGTGSGSAPVVGFHQNNAYGWNTGNNFFDVSA